MCVCVCVCVCVCEREREREKERGHVNFEVCVVVSLVVLNILMCQENHSMRFPTLRMIPSLIKG